MFVYMNENIIFVICGGCRTWIDCIDTIYNKIILKLFSEKKYNIFIYLYLKIQKDDGRKEQSSNFKYETILEENVTTKINEIKIELDSLKKQMQDTAINSPERMSYGRKAVQLSDYVQN